MSLDVQLALGEGKPVLVARFPFVVGRDPEADFTLDAEIVSRRHFQLVLEEGRVVAVDLNSANGLFVNDQRVDRAVLKHYDRIRAGNVELVVMVSQRTAELPIITAPRPRIELGSIVHMFDSSLEPRAASEPARPLCDDPPRKGSARLQFESAPDLGPVNGRQLYFAVIDGARDLELAFAGKQAGYDPVSLFYGEPAPQLANVAPYLFAVPDGAPWFDRWKASIGKHVGILLDTPVEMFSLFEHLSEIFVVTDDSGQEFFFRFYDPRVLRPYLPTCSPDELRELFGPVRRILVENDTGDAYLCYSLDRDGSLITQELGSFVRVE